ncbi:DUF4307 domain-containing protein [Nocardioides cheoyonin]|uniref:DUF4307 domain-containing protein n=1 Tax=Nocardioides cheoyonin TaxID=3156615 RepID=UPI0032B3CEFD
MSSQDPVAARRLADRYGRGPRRSTRLLLVGLGLAIVVIVAWFGWALWVNLHPKVTSGLETWRATSQNEVSVTVVVKVHDDGVTPTCSVEATDANSLVVGRLEFEAEPGRQTVRFKTEREAARVNWDGCTAPGQDDAR